MNPALSKKNSLYNGRKGGVNLAPSENINLDNPERSRVKVLVVTGASGGHIFPALGFLDTLKDKYKNIEISLVLPKRSIKNQIQNFDYDINYISIFPIKLKLDFRNFFAILRFFKGSLESIFMLLRFHPDIVVGFGSLVCIPMVLFAYVFGIKTLIHEQNVIPGRANKFLAKFTDRVAIAFAETKDYFKNCKRKIILTGNPIRKELKRCDRNKALDFFGFSSDKFTILVMGGSSGSHRINIGFLKAISMMPDKHSLQIIHLSGTKDYDLLKYAYKDLNINLRLFSFLKDMQYAYSACDFVISRSGATTIAELISFELAAIIVPYPFAYKHQASNAKVLENKGCAVIIQDSQLDADILKKTIEDFINNPEKIKIMRANYDNMLRPDANDLLVDAVLSLS